MSTMSTSLPSAPAPEPIDLSPRRSGRSVRNGMATVLMGLSIIVVLIPLAFVLFTVVAKGASAISWDFLTADIPPARRTGPGMGPAVVGTIVITGMATLMAVPLGILGAIYLNEYGATGGLPKILRFFADVMTGVPSIIMGLFISAIWVVRFGTSGVTGLPGHWRSAA